MRARGKEGFLLLFAFMLMTTLTVIAAALLFLVAHQTRDAAARTQDLKLLNLAEAGIERAMREIRREAESSTETGTADLRGATTGGTAGTSAQRNRVRYTGDGDALTLDAAGGGTNVVLGDFDLNYLGTRITHVSLGCRYRKSSGGGTSPRLEILYTTNGSFPEAGNSSFDAVAGSGSYNASPYVALDITADRTWTWPVIADPDFKIRARAYDSSNRDLEMDYLFLSVTYEIDAADEPWATGTYDTFPKSLGGGTVESVTIADEQGKAHLNTASQPLLRYLMEEHGVAAGVAAVVATNIVNARASNPFDSIEEVKQVSGMTAAIYDAIEPDITVYSRINTSAQGPAAPRAPININTASRRVLEAVFDPLAFSNPGDVTNLVDEIIAQREEEPFTSFYTSDDSDTRAFYHLERSVSGLSNAEDDRVLGNADASSLSPTREGGNAEDAVTTEFCYDSGVFKVESVGGFAGRRLRVTTILGDRGNRTFTTAVGDTVSAGYRRERFE
ncbi:MAG: general secretion pathway protein GspK [Candidatus Omnitrophica bacterium]|nr:general secretion pathway protein GspK [Candidatus Omnitrophota bacterium]